MDSDLIFRRAVISSNQTPHLAWLLPGRGTGGKDHGGLSLLGPRARSLAARERVLETKGKDSTSARGVEEPAEQSKPN